MSLKGVKTKAAKLWSRADHDWYVEPSVASEMMFAAETFCGAVLDPCCGGGNIVEAARAAGHKATGTDIMRRTAKAWFLETRDFLSPDYPWRAPNIVMNPPFYRAKGAEAFIRKALTIATDKVAAFVDVRFLAGGERANGLYADFPPSRVWMVTPRVSCPPGAYLAAGGEASGGSADWCWLVWDIGARGSPTRLGWLRRAAA